MKITLRTLRTLIREMIDEVENPCGLTDDTLSEDDLDEVAPPGREKQVKALKKQPGVKNPYATSWASYNKRKK